MWFEIFKSGTWKDSEGREKTWTDSDLDTIVAKYDPSDPAPVVIGHPKDNAPAWGWIAALKRQGDTLLAQAKDLVPEFVDMLKRKLFRKRSMSVYPDLRLRHVGFLGAMPPAVKGLADIEFSEGGPFREPITIEFAEPPGQAAADRLDALTRDKMERNPDLSYSIAFSEVQMEYPELVREYHAEVTGSFYKSSPAKATQIADRLDALTKDKMERNPDLSYSMAFSEVQMEYPELVREYREYITA
jgi:hypothetical protein